MSRRGMKVAIKHGQKLKEFRNKSEAEEYFFAYKDSSLEKLERMCLHSDCFSADYSVDSLKELEKWYFDLYENYEFDKIGIAREEFEKIMGVYFGEVAVKNNVDAKWEIWEYPFVKGKYELLVNQNLMSISIGGMSNNLCTRQGNKRKNLMFREYNKYFNR